jgi:alpha-tubulin suppressor-like RCC1 family protein
MVYKRSSSIITICMTLMLVFLLAFPIRVFAQDEAPASTPDPVITVPTEAPVEPTAVVTDVPAEPTAVVTEVPAGPLAEATQVPAEPTAVVTDVPAIEADATAEVTTQKDALPDSAVAPVLETDLSDAVSLLNDADAVVVSQLGEPLALATKEAAEILSSSDPFFWNGTNWVGYTTTGLGCPTNVTCNLSLTPFQAALNAAPVGTTIYVASGNYAENVIINTPMLSFIGFQTINVPTSSTITTMTSGSALVDQITLNADFGTTSGVFATKVIVNPDTASLTDGLNLVAPGGTVKSKVTIKQSTSYEDWQHYINLTAYVKDSQSNTLTFQLECGEPNKFINLDTTYDMTLMYPTNPYIVNYYDSDLLSIPNDGAKELHDLCIAVNYLPTTAGWSSKELWERIYEEQQVYWQVLNKPHDGRTFDPAFQTLVDEIKSGKHNDTPITVGIYFMVPTSSAGVYNPEVQLTFLKKTCDDGNAKTNDVLNADGTCSSTCINGAANAPTCTVFPPCSTDQTRVDGVCRWNACPTDQTRNDNGVCQWNACPTDQTRNVNGVCEANPPVTPPSTPPLTIVPLLIPVTGNTCVPDVITAGIGHTCAVTPETGLRCWGQNDAGQLGDGLKADSTVPVKTKVLDGGEVVQLVSGTKHTCALTAGNEVFCWGLNYSGQLGDGTNKNSNIPVKVKGLEGTIVSISAGENFTCAVNTADKTMCWGNNSGGQFKNGNTNSTSTPVVANLGSDIKLVSGGQSELQGVTNAGAVQFWSNEPEIPVTGLANDVALVSADRFSAGGCAMTNEGKVECWGAITASEITDAKVPTELETGKKTCKVDPLITGEGHGCTITKDNGLVCWGKNVYGQLGNGTQTDSQTPVEVTGIRNVIHLAAGFDHTCAIVDQETIKCWGQNTYGQLGNGTNKESSLPVLVK